VSALSETNPATPVYRLISADGRQRATAAPRGRIGGWSMNPTEGDEPMILGLPWTSWLLLVASVALGLGLSLTFFLRRRGDR
jgi:hypothetical protein